MDLNALIYFFFHSQNITFNLNDIPYRLCKEHTNSCRRRQRSLFHPIQQISVERRNLRRGRKTIFPSPRRFQKADANDVQTAKHGARRNVQKFCWSMLRNPLFARTKRPSTYHTTINIMRWWIALYVVKVAFKCHVKFDAIHFWKYCPSLHWLSLRLCEEPANGRRYFHKMELDNLYLAFEGNFKNMFVFVISLLLRSKS